MKNVTSFRIDKTLMEQLKKLAEKENRTVSNLIETILKKGVDELIKKK